VREISVRENIAVHGIGEKEKREFFLLYKTHKEINWGFL
jgi:hypothetical protein